MKKNKQITNNDSFEEQVSKVIDILEEEGAIAKDENGDYHILEQVEVNHEKGSVGEFIELLKTFPQDGKIDLNGNINISKGDSGVIIYPQDPEYRNSDNESEDKSESAIEADKEFINYANDILDKFSYGFGYADPNMITTFRNGPSDKLLGAPIMVPHPEELDYEDHFLLPHQRAMLDEIRHHNVYVAEAMGELCRRGVSAILEYNTQVLSQFAKETTRDMCIVINKGASDKILECFEDDNTDA